MGLFGVLNMRAKAKRENALIVHVEAGCVAGAYVSWDGTEASIWHSTREPIKAYNSESVSASVERGVRELCETLAREGAPMLLRGTGSASATARAYLGAPWEETRLRKETVDLGREFTVSRATQERALAHQAERPAGRQVEDAVVKTYLNGYETQHPFGKRAHRAEFLVRTSTLDEGAAQATERAMRAALHAHPTLTAFAPAICRAVSALYPHENRYCIAYVAADATTTALVDEGALADVRAFPFGTHHFARVQWREALIQNLLDAAKDRTLPQTIFLIADEDKRAGLKTDLEDPSIQAALHAALRVIPLTTQNVSGVRMRADTPADLPLLLLSRVAFGQE